MSLDQEVADLRARLAALERGVGIDQLPMADLQRALTNNRPASTIDQFALQHTVSDQSIGMLPFCVVRRTAGQSIPNAAFTVISYQNGVCQRAVPSTLDVSNPYRMWRAGTPDQIVATRAGWYAVHAAVSWDINSTGTRAVFITKNSVPGTVDDWTVEGPAPATANGTQQIVSGLLELAVGDIVRVYVYQNSGVALTATVAKVAVYWQHDIVAPPLPA